MKSWAIIILAIIYLVPIARMLGVPFKSGWRPFMKLNRLFGIWENLIRWPRDILITLLLLTGIVLHLQEFAITQRSQNIIWPIIAASLIASSIILTLIKRRDKKLLIEFARGHPTIHPKEFFDHLLCQSGIIGHILPDTPLKTIDPSNLDFRRRNNGRRVGILARINGVWSTIQLARLALFTATKCKDEYTQEVASSLSLIWATRIAELTRAAISVEGKETLPEPGTPQLFLFTHSSFLDFAYATLALASRPNAFPKSKFVNHLPHFLMAKDHFKKNLFLNRVLGLGRAADALGMIFVDRKMVDKEIRVERADAIAKTAAQKLIRDGMEIAIFPQGSRSAPYTGANGERLDSAYYTVGDRERTSADGKHLKKGAAYIAYESALMLSHTKSEQRLELIPIAITGSGIACPKGSGKILQNVHIRLIVGDMVPISALSCRDGVREHKTHCVERIHGGIDSSLKKAAKTHAELERRLFEDLIHTLGPLEIDELAIAMKSWRGEDYLSYSIIDAIYACPHKKRRGLQGELIHEILNFATREDLLKLKGRIASLID